MQYYTEPISRLIEEFSKLPGIGKKTAQRLAFHVINMNNNDVESLSKAILDAKREIKYCSICCNITDKDPCSMCSNPNRDSSVICVVEDPRDVAAMEKIRELVDVNTILGDPITAPDGTIVIPVSKVSFGFVAGGSDLPTKAPKEVFAGGSGAGITINPQAFIVVQRDGDVKMLELGATGNSAIDGIISGVPDLISKIKAIFSKDDEESEEKTEE